MSKAFIFISVPLVILTGVALYFYLNQDIIRDFYLRSDPVHPSITQKFHNAGDDVFIDFTNDVK